MTKYHVNPKTGKPGACRATKNCPFGGEEAHFGSQDEARGAYEASMGNGVVAAKAEKEQEIKWKYDIPSYRLADAVKRIERANRRAEKAGIEERFGYNVETYDVRTEQPDGLTRVEERVRLYLDRPTLQEQGWTFAGTMSWDPEAGLITRLVPGAELEQRPEAEKCDVCKTTRHRSDTYIVKRGGEQLQVGSACLERFMGIKPSGLWMLEFELEDYADAPDSEFQRGGEKWADVRSDSKELMGLALAIVEETGWTSRATARESCGERRATADVLEDVLGTRAKTQEEQAWREGLRDRAAALASEAEEVIAVAKNMDGDSDYERNLKALAESDSVAMRNMPIFISAITAHRRAQKRRADEEARALLPETQWVGNIDEKLTPRVVKVENVKTVDTMYGSSRLVTMRDEDGNVYKTFYSGSAEVKSGESYTMASSTVKKHEEWQGNKETMVGRAKFESVRPAELPPTHLPSDSPYAQSWTVEENAAFNNAEHRRIKKEIKKKAGKQGGWDNSFNRPNDPELLKKMVAAESATNTAFNARYRELVGEEPVEPVETPRAPAPRSI